METIVIQIDNIKEMLSELSPERLQEAYDFVAYLREKERKHRSFVERVLKAEQEPPIRFETVEQAMNAIRDEIEG